MRKLTSKRKCFAGKSCGLTCIGRSRICRKTLGNRTSSFVEDLSKLLKKVEKEKKQTQYSPSVPETDKESRIRQEILEMERLRKLGKL